MQQLMFNKPENNFAVPEIYFDSENLVCEIKGESFTENSIKFYQPYMQWIKEHFSANDSLTLNFRLTYFNTSSLKRILEILRLLKQMEKSGKNTVVNWFITDYDDDILTDVEDFSLLTGIKINMIDLVNQ